MEISVEKIHERVVEALNDEIATFGDLGKVVKEIHLQYQRVYDIYNGKRGKKELPADVISHLVLYLKYSPYWLLLGRGQKKKPLPK